MAIWALVIFWVAVGLGVFLVALRGGRRRGPEGPGGGDTRASRRTTVVLTAVIVVVFGIALPALVLAGNDEDKTRKGPGGVDLNARQMNGRELFAQNCAQCHTLHAVNAVGKVGPNLDELRPPKELVENAIEEGRARGNGQMPADLVTGTDAQDVANFVAVVAGR